MRFSTTAVLASIAVLASAQSLTDLPKCAQTCVGTSLTETGCTSFDIKCICSSAQWLGKLSCCVSQACSQDDQGKTIKFAQDLCATQGVSVPSSASCNPSAGGSSNSSATTSKPSNGTTAAPTAGGASTTSKSTSSTAGAHKEYIGAGLGMAAAGLLAAVL